VGVIVRGKGIPQGEASQKGRKQSHGLFPTRLLDLPCLKPREKLDLYQIKHNLKEPLVTLSFEPITTTALAHFEGGIELFQVACKN